MLEIVDVLPVGPFQCNCVVLATSGGDAVIVDPGDEVPRIVDCVRTHGLTVHEIILTHAHLDHVLGAPELAQEVGGITRLHEEDEFLYQMLPVQGALFGWSVPPGKPIEGKLRADEPIRVGDTKLDVIHTPGHTPGSVCFHHQPAQLLLSGDTLFAGSIGRTDLWGGDFDTIIRSIRDKLLVLDPATRVIAGHGPETTIGDEASGNPFVRGSNGK